MNPESPLVIEPFLDSFLVPLKGTLYLGGVGGGGVGGLNTHNKEAYRRKYSPLTPSSLPP